MTQPTVTAQPLADLITAYARACRTKDVPEINQARDAVDARIAELEAQLADAHRRAEHATSRADGVADAINALSEGIDARFDTLDAKVQHVLETVLRLRTNAGMAAVFGYELGHDDAQRSVSDDHARALLDLIDCARQVDPSEREMLLRAEGCGMCGWDHVAALSNAVDAMPADAPATACCEHHRERPPGQCDGACCHQCPDVHAPAAAATTSAGEPRCCECDQPARLALRWAGKHWCSNCAQLPALPPAAAATTGGEATA